MPEYRGRKQNEDGVQQKFKHKIKQRTIVLEKQNAFL